VNVPQVGGAPAMQSLSRFFPGAPVVGDFIIGDGTSGEHFMSQGGTITYTEACVHLKSDIADTVLVEIRNKTQGITRYVWLSTPGGSSPYQYHLFIVDGDNFPSSLPVANEDEVEMEFVMGTSGQMGSDWTVTLTDTELPPP